MWQRHVLVLRVVPPKAAHHRQSPLEASHPLPTVEPSSQPAKTAEARCSQALSLKSHRLTLTLRPLLLGLSLVLHRVPRTLWLKLKQRPSPRELAVHPLRLLRDVVPRELVLAPVPTHAAIRISPPIP
eukprot:2225569-Rhodomonas_salina.2